MIHPIHPSWQRHLKPIRPYNMERIECTPDQAAAMDRIALGIFTDMVNAGATFQEALSAIYVSGLSHAVAVEQQRAGC